MAGAAEPRRQPRLPDGMLRADGTLATYTAVVRPTVYRGDRLPAELYGNVFVADPRAISSAASSCSDDGTTLRGAKRTYERAEFLASTDERFRPVYLVVRARRHALRRRHVSRHHPAHGLHHQVPARPDRRAQARSSRSLRPHLSRRARQRRGATRTPLLDASDAGAARRAMLAHPNGWWRDTAQQLLVERGRQVGRPGAASSSPSAPADADAAARVVDARRRSTAIEPATSRSALLSCERDVRVSGAPAVRSAGWARRIIRCRARC